MGVLKESNLPSCHKSSCCGVCQVLTETENYPKGPQETHVLKKISCSRGQGSRRHLQHVGAANGKTKVREVRAY